MQEILRDLYWNNVKAIDEIGKLIRAVRIQNEHRMILMIPRVTNLLSLSMKDFTACYAKLLEGGLPWDMDYLLTVVTQIGDAQNIQDYILMGDLYELQLIPSLQDIQNAIRQLDIPLIREEWWQQNLSALAKKNSTLAQMLEKYKNSLEFEENLQQYSLEPTTTGYFTLAIQSESGLRYLHSNRNPLEEARLFAERVYHLEQEKYLVVGWGMGYHIRELLNLYPEMDLVVAEPDLAILYYSLSCWDWQDVLDRVRIVWDSDWQEAGRLIKEDWQLVLYRPELFHIENPQIREQFSALSYRKDSIEDFERVFYHNSRENFRNCDDYVDSIQEKIKGKRVVIVAGGPSLDKNIDQLLNLPEDVIIFSVGTVYKLLLQKGISVDYVVISDAWVYHHVEGATDSKAPVLLLATADRKISKNYQGKKYLVCQEGYDIAAEYAKEKGYRCYSSGGSVATLALDIAIRMQAKSIAFIGLDLAYYGTQMHAAGTKKATFQGYEFHREKGWDGTELNTTQTFLRFRSWMENRIQESDVTMPIVDATEGGIVKKGFEQMPLKDYLQYEKP